MELVIALGHIVGAIALSIVVGFGMLWVGAWETKRIEAKNLQDVALALNVSVEGLDDPEVLPRITRLMSDRFSDELLRNRLSDLCGVIRSGWNWLSGLLQAGILLGVLWFTFFDGHENAIYAWSIVPVMIFFWITSVLFSLACRLLTGRYPGQAKLARKGLSEFISAHPQTVRGSAAAYD